MLGCRLAATALSLTISSCGGGGGDDGAAATPQNGVVFMPDTYNVAHLSVTNYRVSFSVDCHNMSNRSGSITPGTVDLKFHSDDGLAKFASTNIISGTWTQTYLSPTSLNLSITLETSAGTVTIPDLQIALNMSVEDENKNMTSYMAPRHRGRVAKGTATLQLGQGIMFNHTNKRSFVATMGGNGDNLVEVTYSK